MPAPTLVIVPGFWLGTKPYSLFVNELKKAAPSILEIVFAPLKSTGTRSPNAPTMQDDADGIRAVIQPLVEAGRRVVIVAHSAGAFISAMATEDLEVGQKLAEASGGGVERFVFIAGGILPVGAKHPQTDWEAKGHILLLNAWDGEILIKDRDTNLFHDVDPSVAQEHCIPYMSSQPLLDEWTVECTYTGWAKVPSSYIFTENDRTIPPQVQEMCAGLAGSEIVRIPTGHMPMLSEPKMLAEKVVGCLQLER